MLFSVDALYVGYICLGIQEESFDLKEYLDAILVNMQANASNQQFHKILKI